jgi:molybdate transport system permease protein
MQPRRGLPVWFLLPAAVAVLFLLVPLLGLVLRAPWAGFVDLVASPEVLAALALSLRCSVAAALLSLVLGLPLAAWLADGEGRLRGLVRLVVMLPMVLPPVVGGVLLLVAYGRNGLVGARLEQWLHWVLPFTPAGVVVAATWAALPFLVLAVEGGLRSFDRRYADAAATLGAGPLRTFCTVTLPMIAPSVRVGVVVAWARALGEFGATITFAGNLAGETRTLPLVVYVALETNPPAAIAASLLLVVVSGLVLWLLRGQWWPRR